MCADLNRVIEHAEVLIIGKKEDEFRALNDSLLNGRTVIDLVRLFDAPENRPNYQGLCW